ncbi:MAG TPA: hypothetical protein VL689_18950, partial [Paraburkholderia sp.]|nr:hypothetical protein [Paraburkholderia sp.]
MNVLHQIVRQASRTPSAPAVIQLHARGDGRFDERVVFTYRSLVERARQHAARLRKLTGPHA